MSDDRAVHVLAPGSLAAIAATVDRAARATTAAEIDQIYGPGSMASVLLGLWKTHGRKPSVEQLRADLARRGWRALADRDDGFLSQILDTLYETSSTPEREAALDTLAELEQLRLERDAWRELAVALEKIRAHCIDLLDEYDIDPDISDDDGDAADDACMKLRRLGFDPDTGEKLTPEERAP